MTCRILAIDGAPRATGYTREMFDLFVAGAAEAGGEVEEIRLSRADVRPCRGCYTCWHHPAPGICVHRDDMQGLIERFLDCDVLVLATPVYYYSFSALLKTFLERLLPTTEPGAARGRATGVGRNRLRHPERGPGRAVLIAVAAHRDPAVMAGVVESFRLVCDGIDATCAGILLRPESHFLDFAASKPLSYRKVRAAFVGAGRELVEHGRVLPATEEAARSPLTTCEEIFGSHFETYWYIAGEIAAGPADRERLRETAATDPRILIPELAACFNPAAGGDLRARVLFAIGDDPAAHWHLEIADGACRAVRGTCQDPTMTWEMDRETLARIILRRVDARAAIARGDVRVDDRDSLLPRFGRIFPAPSS